MQLTQYLAKLKAEILSYFNISADLLDQNQVESEVVAGVSFKGSQLLILIIAMIIASVGLNTNSVPVIIGAMLISPLMGPIIGMGVAIGTSDYPLLRRSMKNIFMAVVMSLATSAVYFLISPVYGGSSQLLARTSPTIYDVFVGLFGGAAAIVSIACRNKGQVMPGVAIATSLMPPLCTAGYGIATLQPHYFFGALYLFFINAIFILFATWIGVKLMGYRPAVVKDDARAHRVKTVVSVCVVATVILSAYLTIVMVKNNRFTEAASYFVENEMVFPNTQVLSHREFVEQGKRHINVTLIGQELPKDSLQLAMMNKLDSAGLGGTVLTIKQGYSMGNRDDSRDAGQFYAVLQQEIDRRQQMVDSLRNLLASTDRFSRSTRDVLPEVKVLFPKVESLALSQLIVSDVDSGSKTNTDTVFMAFVNAPEGLVPKQREELARYLEVRLKEPEVEVAVNTVNFQKNKR